MGTTKIPLGYQDRPVAIVGCGVMGRRIASIWVENGYNVRIFDTNTSQMDEALKFIKMNSNHSNWNVEEFNCLSACVKGCWLVIEAVPENLEMKIQLFEELEAVAPSDSILATNSSSFKSSLIIGGLSPATRSRVLNTHYHMPPVRMIVELMTCGDTANEIMVFMRDRQKEVHTIPYIVRQESTGFIINRIWAAIKREVLNILAEGVSTPREIDEMWASVIESTQLGPCKMMDETGLDTVAAIEENYVKQRGLPDQPLGFLRNAYLSHGKLGSKCLEGGFYTHCDDGALHSPRTKNDVTLSMILAVDNAVGRAECLAKGRILAFDMMGRMTKTLAANQFLPDGIDIDKSIGRMFWTCMGLPGEQDGAIYSANLDGTVVDTVLATGAINTPKQLFADPVSHQLYFADREGKRIYRCDYSGSGLEILVDRVGSSHSVSKESQVLAAVDWCVGIAVSIKLGKIFWSQKGPPKSGMGRIFTAGIDIPPGESAKSRGDLQCILRDLPEPIHLDLDEDHRVLYWTDRGELPFGNSVNCVQLSDLGVRQPKHIVLARNLHEAIGLKLDLRGGRLFFADSGGTIYSSKLDGTDRKIIYSGQENFTGIALM